MIRKVGCAWLALGLGAILAAPAVAAPEKHTLRYKFRPGETIRWEVVHQASVQTTISGTTQTAETVTKSIKIWRVTGVREDGTAEFEHSVQSVDMRQKLTGRQEVRYNSDTDKTPPAGFENVAKSIGVPLSVITLNAKGEVVHRIEKAQSASKTNEGQVTIPLPEQAVAVGESWSFPYDMVIPINNSGTVKTVKTQQKYTLQSVKNGIATIQLATVVLTPIHDPSIEAQLIQRMWNGTVRFDIEEGRIVGQQMDVDKRVIGFAGGNPNSSLHYLTRFTEELLPASSETASRATTKTE
jgi:hypothetical protein